MTEGIHACASFTTRDQEYQVLLPSMKEGIASGEKIFHIVDPALRDDHLRRLQASGINVRLTEATGQFECVTWDDTYLRGGGFDQSAMLALLAEITSNARKHGFRLTRLVADMGWALQDRPGVGDLVEYEAKATAALAHGPDHAVCVYDRTRVTRDLAMDIVRVHPKVISEGAFEDNPLFIPPPKRFTARCRSCKQVVIFGTEHVSHDEVQVLCEHLRSCRPNVRADYERVVQLGSLLEAYNFTEER